MSLFPQFSLPAAEENSGALPLYQDVQMDWEKGRSLWKDGEPVMTSGLEAVKGWAWRAVQTCRFRHSIFSRSFGCELERLIGQSWSEDTKRSEAERYVQEALLVSPYIRQARTRSVQFEGGTFHMEVELETVYGKGDLYV